MLHFITGGMLDGSKTGSSTEHFFFFFFFFLLFFFFLFFSFFLLVLLFLFFRAVSLNPAFAGSDELLKLTEP